MKILKVFLLTLGLFALVPQLALSQGFNPAGRLRKNEGAIPNHYIVVFNESVPSARVDAFATQLAQSHSGKVGFTYRSALRGFSVEMTEAQAVALSRNPHIEYVEEDTLVEGAAVQNSPTWALDRIDQRSLPLNASYSYANSGAGANVYVIDSGIRMTHQEFGGRAALALDNVGDGQNGMDCNGHGTHVTGIIGGNTYGVAKNAKLWAVRVLNCLNQAPAANIIAGMDWVAANSVKPAVANLSFITTTANDTIDLAVRNLVASGVTTVVAAGNNNIDAGVRSPARVTEAITVAASDMNDNRATFSNFGAVVDVFAPGVDIISASSVDDASTNIRSGTSSAAPFVAGTVARYLSGNRQATPASVSQAIARNATRDTVANAGEGSPNLLLYRPDGKIVFQSGRDGQIEIYTINSDGTEETRLTYHAYSDDFGPEYSPDGSKIAFRSARGYDYYYQVYMMNADGTNVRRVTRNQRGHNVDPAWSPDGKQIAFRSNRDGDYEIYAINVDGTNERRLTYSTGMDMQPTWSPDGTKIAFASYRDSPSITDPHGLDNINIFVMNADGSNQVNITPNWDGLGARNDYYPEWSSDGTKISFVYDGEGNDEIYLMNADGSGRTNLSNLPLHWDYNPSWSSDDSRIVFSTDKDNGHGDIFVMNADGSNQVRLTFNLGDGINVTTSYDYLPDWQAL